MANITTDEANAILQASVAGGTYTSPVTTGTGIQLALVTANGDEDTAGTEVENDGDSTSPSSYSRQTITFSSAASGSISNSAAVNFTNMPAVTTGDGIVGIELWDSADPAVRRWFGALEASKVINKGDTVTFNESSVTVRLT